METIKYTIGLVFRTGTGRYVSFLIRCGHTAVQYLGLPMAVLYETLTKVL